MIYNMWGDLDLRSGKSIATRMFLPGLIMEVESLFLNVRKTSLLASLGNWSKTVYGSSEGI